MGEKTNLLQTALPAPLPPAPSLLPRSPSSAAGHQLYTNGTWAMGHANCTTGGSRPARTLPRALVYQLPGHEWMQQLRGTKEISPVASVLRPYLTPKTFWSREQLSFQVLPFLGITGQLSQLCPGMWSPPARSHAPSSWTAFDAAAFTSPGRLFCCPFFLSKSYPSSHFHKA